MCLKGYFEKKQVIKMIKQLCLVLEDKFFFVCLFLFFFNERRAVGADSIDFELWTKFELKYTFGNHLKCLNQAGLVEVHYV